MHLIHRKTCRVCGLSALTPVIDLGMQYLQGSFVKPGKETPPVRKIPLSLVRCDPAKEEQACGLLQLEHSVPPEILYSTYWYRSGTNQTMKENLQSIAHEATGLTGVPLATVLDIGCNDGTLLSYYPGEYNKFGIDPSNIAQHSTGDFTIVKDFFPSKQLAGYLRKQSCDIITSIAMFYDLEDPIGFAKAVKALLAPNGIWIFEMFYMPAMLRLISYDTICHEHLSYYSLAVIEFILKRAGMKIVNVQENTINGGSFRCYATHADNVTYENTSFIQNIKHMRYSEFNLELDTNKPYRLFQEQINNHKQQLNGLLTELKKQGKRIHIYGASTKGNTLLQWCEIDNKIIDFAAERNPDKYGAYTLGTEIPIISEAESRAMNPDYYLVLPWHFKNEFLKREQESLSRGAGFIFPLPVIEIVRN